MIDSISKKSMKIFNVQNQFECLLKDVIHPRLNWKLFVISYCGSKSPQEIMKNFLIENWGEKITESITCSNLDENFMIIIRMERNQSCESDLKLNIDLKFLSLRKFLLKLDFWFYLKFCSLFLLYFLEIRLRKLFGIALTNF